MSIEKFIPEPYPIGMDDFKEIITNCYVYVDKTLLVKEILDDTFKVVLTTRPRRFGKTLNMSMLKYFFDIRDAEEKSNHYRMATSFFSPGEHTA